MVDQHRPLVLQPLHEVAQDLDDVDKVDGGAPGHDVHRDEALAIEEGQQHLVCPSGMDPGL